MTLDGYPITCAAPGCGSDSVNQIDMGLTSGKDPDTWEVLAEVGLCLSHSDLLNPIREEVEPHQFPTFRIAVFGLVR